MVTTVRQLRDQPELTLLDIKKGTFAGVMTFNDFRVIENANFVDYLRSGWQLSLSVAIDFTASNGQVSDPTSLHKIGDDNEYGQAIK